MMDREVEQLAIIKGYDDEIKLKLNRFLNNLRESHAYVTDCQVSQVAMPIQSAHEIHYVYVIKYRVREN